ncbi:unnamed protein product [Allacma fusca]|nr:unnamed protein product [Allacma fusca]
MNPYKSGNESLKIGLAIDFGMKNSRACTVINGEMSQVAQLGFSDKETIYTKPADKGVYDVKRLIGRSYRDPQIQHFKNIWKFPLSFLDNVPVVVRKNWLPSGASDVKDHIHDVLYHYFHFIVALWDLKGKLIENVVCTVPAHFNWYQRRVYEDVARYDTNLCRNVRTLSEPVAAAIAYFNNNPSKGNEILLVFHLASSTFDLTLLQVSGNNIEILAIGGDQYFGADSFDDTLLDHCLTECRRLTGKFEQRKDEFSLKKLFKWKSQCESVRKSVDPNVVHTVTLEYGISLFKSSAVPVSITRETFNAGVTCGRGGENAEIEGSSDGIPGIDVCL